MKINKQEFARHCVKEGITPLFFDSEDKIYVDRSDSGEVRDALGIKRWGNLTEDEELTILQYPPSEDTVFEISSHKPREGDGGRAIEKEFSFVPTRITFIDGKPLIEGTFIDNWYREDGEKVLFAPFDFSKEYTMELERARRMSEHETSLWVEKLSVAGKPIYQFDMLSILSDVGDRKGHYWPFETLQTGDTLSVTIPARLISDPEVSQKEFEPIQVDEEMLLTQGLFGNSWIIETEGAIFVSGDIEQALKEELQRRQQKAMLIEALADRYAPLDIDRSQHYLITMAARTGLSITTADKDNPQPIAFEDIKPGDKIKINYFNMNDRTDEFDPSPDYKHMFSGGGITYYDMESVSQVWTDGQDIVIEGFRNGVHSIYSTLNFEKELESRKAELIYDRKSIAEHVVDIGTVITAPTLLFSDIKLLDPQTKEPVVATNLEPGNVVLVSGTQIGDMRFGEWNGSMEVTAEITVEQIFNGDGEIAIVAEDGPIFTNVDCREQFKDRLVYMDRHERALETEGPTHTIAVSMDDTFDYPYQDRGYDRE